MNKYLIEILKLRKSVTLPGFGALMIASSKTGKIVLNQHLKYDDGVLAGFIAEKEGIEKTEAKNMISKFVREIESDLGKGETYDIFQFGKLSKDEKGKIAFEMDESLKKESTLESSDKTATIVPPVKKEDKKPENTFTPKTDGTEKLADKKEEVKVGEKNSFVPPVTEIKKSVDKVIEKPLSEIKSKTEKVVEKSTLSVKELSAKKK